MPCVLVLFPSCEEEEESTSPESLVGTTWDCSWDECENLRLVFNSNNSFQWWLYDCSDDGQLLETPIYYGESSFSLSNNILYVNDSGDWCDYSGSPFLAFLDLETITINEIIINTPYEGWTYNCIDYPLVFIQQ